MFEIIQKVGKVSEMEMHTVFNMGIGMTIVVDKGAREEVVSYLKRIGETPFEIGQIVSGSGKCTLA